MLIHRGDPNVFHWANPSRCGISERCRPNLALFGCKWSNVRPALQLHAVCSGHCAPVLSRCCAHLWCPKALSAFSSVIVTSSSGLIRSECVSQLQAYNCGSGDFFFVASEYHVLPFLFLFRSTVSLTSRSPAYMVAACAVRLQTIVRRRPGRTPGIDATDHSWTVVTLPSRVGD